MGFYFSLGLVEDKGVSFSFVLALSHVVVQRIFLVSRRNGFYCCCWFSMFLFLFLFLFLFWVLCNVWQKKNKKQKTKKDQNLSNGVIGVDQS